MGERRVLVVARTLTSLGRVLDVLPAMADDCRVEVVFTVDHGSAFSEGVAEYLAGLGAPVVPWEVAMETAFDLAIAASDRGELERIRAPLLLLPHGAGFQKLSPNRQEVSGLDPSAVRAAACVVLAHGSQHALVDPAARVLVAGDPCLDRLVAGLARRERYREALGVGPGQRVVTLTSTWGRESAFGRHPDLALRALAELPYDECRVVATVHPNVWAFHGAFQLRHWLGRAIDAGLVVLPPVEAWQMGLVAADCVIGDHGSQTVYALGLGLPVVLAAFAGDDVVAGSAMAGLGDRLPLLDPGRPLAPQLDEAVAAHDPDDARRWVAGVVAERGRSLVVLQEAMYELMGLALPDSPPRLRAVRLDAPARVEPGAFHVEAQVIGRCVTLRRFPAVVGDFARRPASRHLVVEDVDGEPTLAESAAVLVHRTSPDIDPAATIERFPACRLVAVVGPDDTAVVHPRAGPPFVVRSPGLDLAVAVSAVYACLPDPPPRVDVTCGARTATVSLTTAT